MLNNNQVIQEGFKPLKKTVTEPVSLPSKPMMNRGMSFNAETGKKESAQLLWEGSSWERMGRSRGRTLDRANSFIGNKDSVARDRSASLQWEKQLEDKFKVSYPDYGSDDCIVVVDPFSTGAHLANEVCNHGLKCVRVLSAWDSPVASLVQQGLNVDFSATIQHDDRLEDIDLAVTKTIENIKELPFNVIAVLPGAETGVELADQLSHKMGLRCNGISLSYARRNKYHMGEAVRSADIRAVKQEMCTTVNQIKSFLSTLYKNPDGSVNCVVKPVQSAGTDDVFLCSSEEEAITAFGRIIGKINGVGLLNDCVLVQEYLRGKEYVVDTVSRDGVHKCVAIWEYDKRPVNGANFVYFGMRLRSADTDLARVMLPYAKKVLDALQIKNGPGHMEIMVNSIRDEDGGLFYDPCLVEVGSRCHGGEGTWLPIVMECIGYSQVNVTLDVYLSGQLFRTIDSDVFPLKKAGRDVDLVSRHGGIVRALLGDAAIRKLPSFRSIHWEVKPGDYIPKTIDCFTRPGCVQLVGETEEVADRDLEAIHDLEPLGLIDYSVICPKPPTIGAVVVVDPFSSGANLSAMVLLWGFKLILVFSEMDSPVSKLVSKSTNVKPTVMIQHDNNHPNQELAIRETLKAIEKHGEGSPVLAIIPGAETGVQLAEVLSSRYGTRSNGEELVEARRDKFLMQEAIRAHKLRAIQQKLCRAESEVIEFFNSKKDSTPKFVVKPNKSGGTDSVYLSSKVEDLVSAFHSIHGQINGLGQLNDGALCQEFLEGKEYVVDGVSRDGVFKIVAIWEYDKRPANGSSFVYFGMRLRELVTNGHEDPEIRAIVDYSRQVISALKIHQGPSHMEIIVSKISESPNGPIKYSPCLVEVGTRCHGGEASWFPVALECVGYTHLDATLNCYLRPDRFDALPMLPTLVKQGIDLLLVSYEEGMLKDIPGLEKLRELSSFRRMEMLIQPGSEIRKTIDCFTRPGSVQLVNGSKDKLEADFEYIRGLEFSGLFEVC